jgi:CRISPR-associated protein Csh2
VREIDDITLNMNELLKYLNENKNKIKKISYWYDSKLKFKDGGLNKLLNQFSGSLNELEY